MPLGDFFSANLSRLLQGGPRTRAVQAPAGEGKLVWITFALCLICSGVGVGLSFLAFGTVVAGIRMWGVGFDIAVVMLGLLYAPRAHRRTAVARPPAPTHDTELTNTLLGASHGPPRSSHP